MRKMIAGMVAAVAMIAAAPAMACGYSPCGYSAPIVNYGYVNSGCNPCGGGGWAVERLPDPVQQYYYVNQGPTYTGPGNYAPRPVYEETLSRPAYGYGYGYRHHHYRPWYPRTSYYHRPRVGYGYGYAPRRAYGPAAYHYGHRALRRYY